MGRGQGVGEAVAEVQLGGCMAAETNEGLDSEPSLFGVSWMDLDPQRLKEVLGFPPSGLAPGDLGLGQHFPVVDSRHHAAVPFRMKPGGERGGLRLA